MGQNKSLGITFNVDLNVIRVINLNAILEKNLTDINNWQSRQLTPIAKITVLKTTILSKFIHIFSVLPISESFIHKLHTIFFKFLWNNKPDKAKRETVCCDYLMGGLKMINVHAFIHSLKVCWARIFSGPDCHWLTLFNVMYTYSGNLHFESMWGNVLIKRMSNAFWVEVIENWQILCGKQEPISNSDLMNTSIWYNPKILREPPYFSNWFNAGVSLLGDVLNDKGKIESFETLQKRNSINCNILDYYRIKLCSQLCSKVQF